MGYILWISHNKSSQRSISSFHHPSNVNTFDSLQLLYLRFLILLSCSLSSSMLVLTNNPPNLLDAQYHLLIIFSSSLDHLIFHDDVSYYHRWIHLSLIQYPSNVNTFDSPQLLYLRFLILLSCSSSSSTLYHQQSSKSSRRCPIIYNYSCSQYSSIVIKTRYHVMIVFEIETIIQI